jgi:predicted metal-dependent hydrolase
MKSPWQLDAEIADHQERVRLSRRVLKLLDKWQPILGVHVNDFRVKKMQAFAGFNVHDERLWVGQACVKLSPAALEYVIVHELVHALVADRTRAKGEDPEAGSGHDARYYALMDRVLPTWRRRHAKLHGGEGVVARALPGMG